MKLHFLAANGAIPLTKTIGKDKKPYPMVRKFTSYEEEITSPEEFYDHLTNYAEQYLCLLKGELSTPLVAESRAGRTDPNASTEWICLDVDGLKVKSPDELLVKLGLQDVTYILQYSCSSGAGEPPNEALRAHLFLLLSQPVPAPDLKRWLMHMNLNAGFIKKQITLAASKVALRWPLDVTTCQSDKLIYISPPILRDGLKDFHAERIQFCKRASDKVDVSLLHFPEQAELDKSKTVLLNKLRASENLLERTYDTKLSGGRQGADVLRSPDRMDVTGTRTERGFTYVNLNGGDSWGYYHPVSKPTVLYNFKGEPNLLIGEINPEYAAAAREAAEQAKEVRVSATEEFERQIDSPTGTSYLAFTDTVSDLYYRGSYCHDTGELDVRKATSVKKVEDFLKQHGQPVPDYIPEWTYEFDFQSDVRFDAKKRFVNRYVPTSYLSTTNKYPVVARVPTVIHKVLWNVVGNDQSSYDLFLNWLACIIQLRRPPRSAWVFFGIEGTGKGTLFNRILAPIVGKRYVTTKKLHDFESEFNAFLQDSLFVLVDESQVSTSTRIDTLMANIRMYITEPTIPVRAMRTDHFDIRNWASFVFASNKPDPIQIPISDRRFHVAKYQPNKLEITDRELEAIETELMDFTAYLMHYRVDVAKARTPSKNSQREKIQYLTRTSIDETTEAFREGNIDYFLEHFNVDTVDLDVGPSIADAVYRRFIREAFFHAIEKKRQRVTRDTLQQLCEYLIGRVPNTPAKFSKFIRHHGIELTRLRADEGSPPTYGITVKWKITKRTRTDWESFFSREGSPSRLRVVK